MVFFLRVHRTALGSPPRVEDGRQSARNQHERVSATLDFYRVRVPNGDRGDLARHGSSAGRSWTRTRLGSTTTTPVHMALCVQANCFRMPRGSTRRHRIERNARRGRASKVTSSSAPRPGSCEPVRSTHGRSWPGIRPTVVILYGPLLRVGGAEPRTLLCPRYTRSA